LQEAEEATRQVMEDRKKKEVLSATSTPTEFPAGQSAGPSAGVITGTSNSYPAKPIGHLSVTFNAPPQFGTSPGQAGGAGERVGRAKSGIISALKEIHTNLTRSVNAAKTTTNLQEIMVKVKNLKAVKAELQKASEVVTLKIYQYSAPQVTEDKLAQIHSLLSQEAQMITNLLNDIENGIALIEQPTQLVVLVKLCKNVLNLVK